MPFTVLSVAYPFAPVGPYCVGGAEQILTELDGALAESGCCSLVMARESSQVAGELRMIAGYFEFYADLTGVALREQAYA